MEILEFKVFKDETDGEKSACPSQEKKGPQLGFYQIIQYLNIFKII